MLKNALIDFGFRQSQVDPCLFLRKDLIVVSYVDDCLLFCRDQKTIDTLLTQLKSKFVLTDEGPDVKAYLGLKVEKSQTNGTITFTQPALITRILIALSLDGNESTKTHDTPATKVLHNDENGEARRSD